MANRKVLRIKRANFNPIAADSGESVVKSGDDKSTDSDEPIATTNDNGNGSEDSAADFVNPEIIAGNPDPADSEPTGKRKRGRPKGSSNKSTPAAKAGAENLTAILYSLHLMGASFLSVPELVISEEESARLAVAIEKVNEFHPIKVLSPEVTAWIQLAMCAGTIYGPRFMAAKIRKGKETAAKKNAAQTVINMPVQHAPAAPVN